jgi:hypothetical protein
MLCGEILGFLQELIGRLTGDLSHALLGLLPHASQAGLAGIAVIRTANGSNERIQKLPVIDHEALPLSSTIQAKNNGSAAE